MTISRRSDPRRPRSSVAAFTLVEVMIAMSIAIVALLGYLASLSTSAKLQTQTQRYDQASRAMRQVLADHARTRNRAKRPADRPRITLDQAIDATDTAAVELVDLDDSLRRLASLNERHARVVELRFFGGLTIAETAAELGVSHDTIEKGWFMARAWLHRELCHPG